MFEQEEVVPWYRSTAALIGASILLPPVGLVLLWIRGDKTPTKVIGSVLILLLSVGYVVTFKNLRRSRNHDDQYTALEQHRAQQEAAAATSAPVAVATPSPQPSASASPGASPVAAPAVASGRNSWTTLRGAKRDGKYEETIRTNWPADGLPLLWKQPIGVGFASFAIADGRAYTIEQRRQQEMAVAYDFATGKELWKQAWNAAYTDSTGDGPRSTPTWDQGRVYVLGATGEFRCLDAGTGAVIWGKNILTDNQAQNLPWAMSASPLIVDDKVIVLPGGTSGKSVVAYNKMTGAPVWRSQNDAQAYVSPMLMELGGRRQVVVVSASRVMGLAPENGALLWSHPWSVEYGINVSQPIVVDKNRFFISSGYGKGAALIELKGSGNSFTPAVVWENNYMKNKFNSSVLHNGYVYGMDEQFLTCVDVNTGERKWKGARYAYGQVLLASGHLIVSNGDTGEISLVKASPDQYSEVAKFPALQGKTWNYPAIADGRLLVRNATEMASFDISAK